MITWAAFVDATKPATSSGIRSIINQFDWVGVRAQRSLIMSVSKDEKK